MDDDVVSPGHDESVVCENMSGDRHKVNVSKKTGIPDFMFWGLVYPT